MVPKDSALPGRPNKMRISDKHFVLGNKMEPPYPDGLKVAVFANGCFWGSEKGIWRLPGGGIYATAVGYAAGYTPNPTYEEACSGMTGHTEACQVPCFRSRPWAIRLLIRPSREARNERTASTRDSPRPQVVYDPAKISFVDILRWFWEAHDPTQGMGQGNDRGTQYRSGFYWFDEEQKQLIEASKAAYEQALRAKGLGAITTECAAASDYPQLSTLAKTTTSSTSRSPE